MELKEAKDYGTIISWAEYIATTEAACEAVWLQKILKDLQAELVKATKIYCDNVSAIAMTKNLVFYAWTKHIELWHHFISELVSQGEVELKYIETNKQPTNVFTKAATLDKLERFNLDFGIADYEGLLKCNQQSNMKKCYLAKVLHES